MEGTRKLGFVPLLLDLITWTQAAANATKNYPSLVLTENNLKEVPCIYSLKANFEGPKKFLRFLPK